MKNSRIARLTASAVLAAVVGSALVAVSEAPAQAAIERLGGSVTCPTAAPAGTLRGGSDAIGVAALCKQAVSAAATPQAALAIIQGFRQLGAPYACGGVGRMDAYRFDCSSFVSRAYYLGAGLETAGSNWAPSTQDMVPWGGAALASWAKLVAPAAVRPGDLVLYDTGGATYRHVVMYLGNGLMMHTSHCGDVAHVTTFWGFGNTTTHKFLVARRVANVYGVAMTDPRATIAAAAAPAKKPATPAKKPATPAKKPATPAKKPATPALRTVSYRAVFQWGDVAAVRTVQLGLNKVAHTSLTGGGHWGVSSQAAWVTYRRTKLHLTGSAVLGAPRMRELVQLGQLAGFAVTV
jgi:cell wall-associated NlpC family hydrolase